jgi:hypothetical protein
MYSGVMTVMAAASAVLAVSAAVVVVDVGVGEDDQRELLVWQVDGHRFVAGQRSVVPDLQPARLKIRHPYPIWVGTPGSSIVSSRCRCIAGLSSFPMAAAGAQMWKSSSVEIIAAVAQRRNGSRSVAAVYAPFAARLAWPWACGYGNSLLMGNWYGSYPAA